MANSEVEEEQRREKEISGKGERERERAGGKLPLLLQRGAYAEILLKKRTHSDWKKLCLGPLLFASLGTGS